MASGRNPPIDVAPIDPLSGRFIPVWYDRFKFLDSLQPLSEITHTSFTVPAITPGSTSASFTAFTLAPTFTLTPVISPTFAMATTQQFTDAFASLSFYINSLETSGASVASAISALNTRLTALENKIDAVIADLAARFP